MFWATGSLLAKRPHVRRTPFLCIALCAWPLSALAQDAGQAPEMVLITAHPPDPVGNDAFSVTRLDGVALRAQPGLDQALEQVPGLSLFRRNTFTSANPTTQGVSLRSIGPSAAGRALVTLDGVPQNDPFGGWVIWSSLPSEDIAAAEVVRGAGAGPYGAGALTGVIALSEHERSGLVAADVTGGELETVRTAAAGGEDIGKVSLFGSASYFNTAGWNSVSPAQRGPADNNVTLEAENLSLRLMTEPFAGAVLAVRGSVYQEFRDSGLVNSTSRDKGASGSVTLAHPEGPDDLGWRLQFWLRDTDFAQTSVTVNGGRGRTSTTPSNLQYATPALGLGMNAAVRGSFEAVDWEVGVDARSAQGESQEQFSYSTTLHAYTQGRIAGGRTFVGGAYAEAASRFGDGWLLTAGVRADEWSSSDGHLKQTTLATGVMTVDQDFPDKSGWVPTGRLGVRKELFDGFYLRSAGYIGFRAPTLNELYRPFRLGNNATIPNPALAPEQLKGGEVGGGGEHGPFSWDVTVFWNQLEDAITNVTTGVGPQNVPGIGAIPAGGLIIQRQNVGHINALGIEGGAQLRLSDNWSLNAAFDLADSHVDGATTAPQLTGKRPQQQPRWTITGGFIVTPVEWLTLSAFGRYESVRYADDLNTLRLPSAFTLDVKGAWNITRNLSLYLAVDNLYNAKVATTESADGVFNYDQPRVIRGGLSWVQ